MSQWRRRAVLATLALTSPGCDVFGRSCTDIGCLDGFNLFLRDGGFDPDKTYTIELKQLMPTGNAVPVMNCSRTWPTNSGARMDCTSALPFVADPNWIRISDHSIKKLRVTISADGALVAEKDYDVAFSRREINGKGCGWCTSASVNLDIPARPVWGAQGESIRSGLCRSDDLGMTGFAATRDQLSAEQLRLLSELRAVPDPAPSCPMGQMDCFAEVFYHDGHMANWHARPSDGTCSGIPIPGRPEQLISFATFDPFRKSLGCWYSGPLTAAANAAAAGNGPLPIVQPSAICQHGITATAGTTTTIGLEVPADPVTGVIRPRHIQLHNCNKSVGSGPIDVLIFDSTGSTPLARGANRNDGSWDCQLIDLTFPAAGTYLMKVIVSPTYASGTVFLSYD